MAGIKVASADELRSAGKKVVSIDGVEIGLFCVDDEFYAWHNECPHQGGPVCQGRIFGLVEEVVDEDRKSYGRRYHPSKVNIVCPWHGAEFDIRTGRHPGVGDMALKPARLTIENDEVFVHV